MSPDPSPARMPLEASVVEGQLRTWHPGVVEADPVPFVVLSVTRDTHPQMVDVLERGRLVSRRMGEVLAWSEPT